MNQVAAYERLAGVYDEIVVDPCYARWAAFLDQVWSTDATPVRSVLDIGCGTGLLGAELIALGYRVTGVDPSPAMLARARTLLGPQVTLVEGALPALTVGGSFDAVTSTFDAVNYLPTEVLDASLASMAARLRPGGWLVFDLHTDAMMDFTAANPVVSGEADGMIFEITTAVNRVDRTCETRIEMTRSADGDSFSEVHRQSFHSDGHVLAAIAAAGLELVAVTDEYTEVPADAATMRATWVTRAP